MAGNNSNMRISTSGIARLKKMHERVVPSYCSDPVGHCTYGVGTLVHLGPCTAAELRIKVTDKQITSSLHRALTDAQTAIKRQVHNVQLTQDQFDALTSFVYNRGSGASRNVLNHINQGNIEEAARLKSATVYGTVKDRNTGRIEKKRLPGLITRRRYETQPFRSGR